MTPSVWDFSIALEISTHQGVLYLDIRIRLCWQVDILNLHLVSIPVFDRHTGENMFNVYTKFFDCICQEWRNIIVGIVNDCACSMTGRIKGIATQFEQGVLTGLIWVWCRGHQLDLLLQDFFKTLLDEQFYLMLTAFVVYLRQQQKLISEMKP